MYIETAETPNPLTLKFLPQCAVSDTPQEFRDVDTATGLAAALLRLDGVAAVFFGHDFIAITKDSTDRDWRHMKAPVIGLIMDHFVSGRPLLGDGAAVAASTVVYDAETQPIVDEILQVIDERVRPAVAQDGGDIVFDHFDTASGVVYLQMRGACAGCPSSTMTLKSGIEGMLKRYVPEVSRVEAVL